MIEYRPDGFNEDGTPRLHIVSDGHVVLTGNIVGTVEVGGKVIDVSAPAIEVESPEEGLLVSDAIGARHIAQGHPDFVADPDKDSFGFIHVDSSGVPHISAAAAPETIAAAGAAVEAHPDLETGSLVKVEV